MTPVLTIGEVLSRKRYGDDYHSVTLVAPQVSEAVRPGQFVNVKGMSPTPNILRRPFSIFRVHKQGGWTSAFELVFDVRGAGTRELAALDVYDKVDVMGPLGNGFNLPKRRARCLLVGGGIGAVPLFFLADRLREEGHRIDVVLGARTSSLLLNAMEARRFASVCSITTEDGSAGEPGVVTDVLAAVIERCGTEIVYACGPDAMLAAVTSVCKSAGVPVQVSVEELMGCGYGVCSSCVIPLRNRRRKDATGETGVVYARACSDGPVFSGTQVIWDRVVGADVR